MLSTTRRIVGLIGTLILFGLVLRLALTLARTETGWSALAWHLRDACVSLVAGDPLPFGLQDPEDQAEQLLLKIQHLAEQNPEDAELMAGAAVLLSEPDSRFEARYRGSSISDASTKAILQGHESFADLCQGLRMKLARRATELQPRNVHWWRLRAILLWRFDGSFIEPCGPEWRDVLRQGTQHDPDNALYDYLEATADWNAAVDKLEHRASSDFQVVDEGAYAQALEAYERGLQRGRLEQGNGGIWAAVGVVDRLCMRPADKLSLIASRSMFADQGNLLFHFVWAWRNELAWWHIDHQRTAEAVRNYQEQLRTYEQLTRGRFLGEYDRWMLSWKSHALARLTNIGNQRRHEVRPEDLRQWNAMRDDCNLKFRVIDAASRDAARLNGADWARIQTRQPMSQQVVSQQVVSQQVVSQQVVLEHVPTLILMLGSIVATARFIRRQLLGRVQFEPAGVDLVKTSVCGILSVGLSFVVFGMGAAEVPNWTFHAWATTVVIIGVPVALALIALIRQIRLKGPRLSLRAMMLIVLNVALMLAVVQLVPEWRLLLPRIPLRWHVFPRGVEGLHASDTHLLWRMAAEVGPWNWAWLQWRAWSGPWVALGLWCLLQTLLSARRFGPSDAEFGVCENRPVRCRAVSRWSAIGGHVATCIERPAFWLATMLLGLFLLFAPRLLFEGDARHQAQMAKFRSNSDSEQLQELIESIVADPIRMGRLRAEIDTSLPSD